MKRALISDIHSNLEALRAVLDDIRGQGISEIYCLGDIIGYGPNPRECLDLVIRMPVVILGNHDQAALFDPDGFNPVALRAISWTREQLEDTSPGAGGQNACNKRWDFLGELPRLHVEGDILYVHGSPRDPTNEYIFPEDVYNPRKMETLFGKVQKYCFQGHTHIPGVFRENMEFVSPEDCDHEFRLTDEKIMVNVGSVGQPRDGDPRSCYVIQTDDLLQFRRVDYDREATIRKVYDTPQLDKMLGDRLREGREPSYDENMKRALISDIHGNLEALTAVLAHIADQGIDEIYCLGDIIGYGPNPCECIDLVMQCKVCVLGNHDQGALFDPEGFSSGAEKAIFWTRDQLEQGPGDAAQRAKRWDYLCDLPRIHRENGLMLVHGSARNPLNEYVFPEDTFNVRKIDKIFALVDRVCFQGHTHVPGVFVQNYQFLSPQDLDGRYTLGSEKALVNVGSVGQPRDGNPRSCYVVLDGDEVNYQRVEYPAQVTADKIYAIPELDNFLGDRLLEGR